MQSHSIAPPPYTSLPPPSTPPSSAPSPHHPALFLPIDLLVLKKQSHKPPLSKVYYFLLRRINRGRMNNLVIFLHLSGGGYIFKPVSTDVPFKCALLADAPVGELILLSPAATYKSGPAHCRSSTPPPFPTQNNHSTPPPPPPVPPPARG